MEKGWVKIFSSGDVYRVEIARQVLEEAGIKAVLIDKRESAYRLDIGEAELYVRQEDVIMAKRFLKNLED